MKGGRGARSSSFEREVKLVGGVGTSRGGGDVREEDRRDTLFWIGVLEEGLDKVGRTTS